MSDYSFKYLLDQANLELLSQIDEKEWKKSKTDEIFQRVIKGEELCGCKIIDGNGDQLPIIPCGGIKIKVDNLFDEFINQQKKAAYALAKLRFNEHRAKQKM